jgi:ketosteroid isomerase-like protein
MSKIESGIRIVIAFNEAFNRQDVSGLMALMSDDCIVEDADSAPGGAYRGRDAVTLYWQDFFGQWPQAHSEIEELFGFGERCIMRWKYSHVKADTGFVRGVDLFRVRTGLICEKLSYIKHPPEIE